MRVALVEIGGSHDECLYAQVKFLKSDGHFVALICGAAFEKNVSYFDDLDEVHYAELRPGLVQWKDLWAIRKLLVKGNFDAIVLNTAQGNVLKNFLLLPKLKRWKFYGILHKTDKLEGSFSQKILTKNLEAYFVLNDYLLENIPQEIKSTVRIHSFYPIFYPNYPLREVNKKDGDVWICVPGQVEDKRRDYEALFDGLSTTKLHPNIKFLFLGKSMHEEGSGKEIRGKINELGLQENFILWDGFIETELFYSVVRASDYILPLIHPDHKSFSLYQHQISGAFNLAIGYHKPMLMDASFESYDDFKDECTFYSRETMISVINGLVESSSQQSFYGEKWSFEAQKKRYMDVLNGN